MALSLIRFFALVVLLVATAQAKGIFDSLRNDYQQSVVPEYPPQYFPAGNSDPLIQAVLEKPPVNSPGDVSAPRVVGHTYHIFKTILRPQMFRQMVTVPYLQRYIRTFQAPILETVHIQREIPF